MLLRQVFLRAKFFARKKHGVRVRKPKKEKMFDLGFEFEKAFDLGLKFEKKTLRYVFRMFM